MFQSEKDWRGLYSQGNHPHHRCTMPHAHTASRDAESFSQGWAKQAALLVGKSPCVRESFLCNSTDLAAFTLLAVEKVMWKALSSSNLTSELGAMMLQCSNKLQLRLGNFKMSFALSGSFRVHAVSHRDLLSILPRCASAGDPLGRGIPQIIPSP